MRRGFTLVEQIVSLFLFTLFLSLFFWGVGGGLRSFGKIVEGVNRSQVESLVRERIISEVRSADEILASSSTSEVSLRVGSEVISYGLRKGKVWRKKNSHLAYLTNEGEINSLTFGYLGERTILINLGGISTVVSIRN
jgi:hypothetical protein